jgi:RNA polymerase II subunit A-like phosphatase
MNHDASGVTVSVDVGHFGGCSRLSGSLTKQEARRLEDQIRTQLLAQRRLTLIVDLDQTIIHTTVDPTVGEWMDEIAQEEGEVVAATAAAASKNGHRAGAEPPAGKNSETDQQREERSTTPDHAPPSMTHSTSVEPRPSGSKNPNAAALADVARFTVPDDVPPGWHGHYPASERFYFTKPR